MMSSAKPTVMVETEHAVYIVDSEVYAFVVGMHPDAFDQNSIRAMANSLVVIDKKTGRVIKARSFNPNGN
jgi:hypothetical protein